MAKRVVITGAFSYTGSAVARELARRGWSIHTLTNRPRPEGADAISSAALDFDPAHLRRELAGADAFVNTFWVRIPWKGRGFASAVERSATLFAAARDAGVGRVVHVSVSNARKDSGLGYYRGKAEVEELVRRTLPSYAIVRPTLVVGPSDVLSSNIAWLLRRFPVFFLPRRGAYRLQPVTLDDNARIIADAVEASGPLEVDAAGPEIYTFAEYVRLLARSAGVRRWMPSAPNGVCLAAVRALGWLVRDVVLTREELLGLEQELLLSHAPPLGRESVASWLGAHGDSLGRRYVNDVVRHFGAGTKTALLNPAAPG